jgi:hypothetical protein
VHLLAPNKDTASLARDFARGNRDLALGGGEVEFLGYTPSPSLSSKVGFLDKEDGGGEGSILPLPILRRRKRDANSMTTDSRSESGLETGFFPFIFECRLLPNSVVEVYDHTIVVGTIVRAITSATDSIEGTNTSTDNTDSPSEDLCLTYANTRFWEVGKEI